tara:strand:- start:1624 stop:2112 length:489 start_codon:yes stop_codon:yes gene_type:complete
MANRVLLGNRSTGGYGMYVSKAGSNVVSCNRKDLLFDSSQQRAGEIYAGGTQSTLSVSGQNFLTTNSKSNLGYIPLVICSEDKRGEFDDNTGDDTLYRSRRDFIQTTSTTISPKTLGDNVGSTATSFPTIIDNRISADSCTNLRFLVLKIPCAYGYMTSTYF